MFKIQQKIPWIKLKDRGRCERVLTAMGHRLSVVHDRSRNIYRKGCGWAMKQEDAEVRTFREWYKDRMYIYDEYIEFLLIKEVKANE